MTQPERRTGSSSAGRITIDLVGNLLIGADLGSFAAGQYRNTYNTGAFQISFGEGHLSQYCSAYFSYDDVLGAALVCYASDGAVYTL